MKGFIKAVSAAAMICTMVFVFGINCEAKVTSEDKVIFGYEKTKYTVTAFFNPAHEIAEGEEFTLEEGSRVKRAYVRAKSDGCVIKIAFRDVRICSDYDSGRLYSAEAKKGDNRLFYTPTAEVGKCWSCTQRTMYGWEYFD